MSEKYENNDQLKKLILTLKFLDYTEKDLEKVLKLNKVDLRKTLKYLNII
jgi:microsomal dipeptidase-like Zn-dependent dipeptidase